jgi:hypothetical protein
MWADGRWQQLERYCAQDVHALAELVLRAAVRVPGGTTTTNASLQRMVMRDGDDDGTGGGTAGSDDAERALQHGAEHEDEPPHDGGEDHAETPPHGSGETGGETTQRRSAKRKYDATQRRRPRKARRKGYMDRGGWRGVKRSAATEVGPATIERVVQGRYEWRDGAMRPLEGARRRYWERRKRQLEDSGG